MYQYEESQHDIDLMIFSHQTTQYITLIKLFKYKFYTYNKYIIYKYTENRLSIETLIKQWPQAFLI